MLGIRPEDVAADDEYAAVLRCAGLDERQLQRIRMVQSPLGNVDLDQWSGIILGGGPYQASDHEETKSTDKTARHFGWPRVLVKRALAYANAFPEEISRGSAGETEITSVTG